MKTLSLFFVLASFCSVLLTGCKSGPSPEQQNRDADDARETAKKEKDFAKSLPPVQNPGEGN